MSRISGVSVEINDFAAQVTPDDNRDDCLLQRPFFVRTLCAAVVQTHNNFA